MSQLPPQGHPTLGPNGGRGPSAGQAAPPTQAYLAPAHWAAYGPPPGWAPPPAWGPPPGWVAPGWGQVGWGPGWVPLGRSFRFDRSRLLPTLGVALVIAAVVLGGIGLDNAIPAPSAGVVTIGGSVTMTAGPGWVLEPSQDASSSGIELRRSGAVLSAEVVSSSYSGDSSSMLADQKDSLNRDTAQISYGDAQTTSVNGHDTTFVVFEATVATGHGPGTVDGELICMVVNGNAVVIGVAAQQGDLDPVIDDVTAMLKSVEAAP